MLRRLDELVGRARDNKLAPADVRGGTFTISNHGVSGSLFATPIIIAQPQSAILGVGKLEKRVVVREVDGIDTIQIRPMVYVSLTIDQPRGRWTPDQHVAVDVCRNARRMAAQRLRR